MDIINSGIDWLESQRSEYLTEEATYTDGASSVLFLATRGQTRWEEENYDTGVISKIVTRDWIVAVDELTFEPVEGAHIIALDNGVEKAYELISIGDAPFFKLDQYQKTYRIHTQNVPMIVVPPVTVPTYYFFDDTKIQQRYVDDAKTKPYGASV